MHFNFLLLIACVLICEAAGLTGLFTQFTRSAWFKGLHKSVLQPPGFVMEWVWVGVYALMGCALYLVWRMPEHTHGRTIALIVFAFQLVLSALWPLFFFKMKHPFIAFAELLVMWMFVLGTVVSFSYLTIAAFFLLAPVMAWVLFEAYLNFTLLELNEGPTEPSHMKFYDRDWTRPGHL
jgi:benzodiazapine receptor